MNYVKSFMLAIMAAICGVLIQAAPSYAAFTLPTLPVTDLEAAGTAVAALVATFVLIGMAIRMLKRA